MSVAIYSVEPEMSMMRCPCCGSRSLGSDPLYAVRCLGLRGDRMKMAELLAQRVGQYRNSENIAAVVFGDRASGGPLWFDKRVAVMKCQLNPLLAKIGLHIEGHLGVGYRMMRNP